MSQLELNAVFSRKEPTFEPSNCIVEKVIQLSGAEYDRFRRNMLADHDFIRDNIDLMYHEGDKLHCIMAVGEGRADGVLIDSSGSAYARYAAFIPNAADILAVRLEREAPALTDAGKDWAYWTAVTESSQFRWTEDVIVRLNGYGSLYYIGGEDGQFIQIDKDGRLAAGTYEGAVPHIGDAMFKVAVEKKYPDFNAAFTAALAAGGKKFLADMFSGNPVQRPREEKPSVVSRIQEARLAPAPPKEQHTPKKEVRGDNR